MDMDLDIAESAKRDILRRRGLRLQEDMAGSAAPRVIHQKVEARVILPDFVQQLSGPARKSDAHDLGMPRSPLSSSV